MDGLLTERMGHVEIAGKKIPGDLRGEVTRLNTRGNAIS
ncbi:Hypothetical protein (plasmid) [Pseudomonas putida]|nr:Hypothetical protein [Pseudomonas putida]